MSDNAELEKRLSEEATLKILDQKLTEFFEEAKLKELVKDKDSSQKSTIDKAIAARVSGGCYDARFGRWVTPCPF
ncbi:MAG: hypothetical protein MH252_10740 [Thermosynechococcaceae cyanobacterium MS004]|nr:hypothetical protein [Thermosynechococcaceae cyanobacterium MS004]